ncbi:OLC1v1024948C1 [Oldenlandia corymbosa var. corymbosa]|uniref:OLC1v1024948C1 n=1 Tax=Oldenlandia corymbosa var. corymbosa TaxID=529605 RepID=A0AAV1C5X6_OLDCO|nr:OLC1v1024948C1 [Oldenlandia corymbosa var. corymbosa]
MEPVRDWSTLIHEILEEIAKRILVVEDFMTFRGVCASLQAPATKDKFVQSLTGVPLLMLAEKGRNDEREFYSLLRRKIVMRLPLPEMKGKKCVEAGFEWFLTVSEPGEIDLFNPRTCSQIQLPNCTAFPDFCNCKRKQLYKYTFMSRAALSANPSHMSDFVVTVIYHAGTSLGFWRSGDLVWTKVEENTSDSFWWDIIHSNGKFFAITASGGVCVWDESSPFVNVAQSAQTEDTVARFVRVARVLFSIDVQLVDRREAYLVESSSGDLLVITRDGIKHREYLMYGVTNFKVIRLDLTKCKWEEISNLGMDAIFVGHSSATSIVASAFSDVIKANCIYFTDDCFQSYAFENRCGRGGGRFGVGGGEDMGIYNLEHGTITRFFSDILLSLSFICPSVWISF